MSTTVLRDSDLRARAEDLGPYLAERLGTPAGIEHVRVAGEGMSDTTMLLRLTGGRDLVLRCHRPAVGDLGEDGLARQYRLLQALAPTPVPAPRPLLLEPDPDVLGAAFLVTERLPGAAVVPWSTEGRAFLARVGAGPAGIALFDHLVAIHAVPTGELAVTLETTTRRYSPAGQLETLRAALDVAPPDPVLEDAAGWLAAHLPAPAAPALVHGDYRAGNLLFDGERISGVLDWEFAHVGDPVRDLAWLGSASNRVDPALACDMVPLDEVVPRYEAAGGRPVDRARLDWWGLCVLTENALTWMRTTAAWRAGEISDLRVARWSYTLPRIRRLVATALEDLPA